MIFGRLLRILDCFLLAYPLAREVRLDRPEEGALVIRTRHPLQLHHLFRPTRYLIFLSLKPRPIVAIRIVLIQEALFLKFGEPARGLRECFLSQGSVQGIILLIFDCCPVSRLHARLSRDILLICATNFCPDAGEVS